MENYDAILKSRKGRRRQPTNKFIQVSGFYNLGKLNGGKVDFVPNLNNVYLKLVENGIAENDVQMAIKKEINALTPEQIILEPYTKLIAIGGFETFITVNYDNFLERAFEAEGRLVNKSFNFSNPFSGYNAADRKDAALPKIYNLMGSLKGVNFAITDEQSLEFLYMFQNGMESFAKGVFLIVAHKEFSVFGLQPSDWFMRFLFEYFLNNR
ncbi:MAG: SIR2 family protein [Bacteroidetes bacterium]|nr:SIR2 family protein [Bacteroidota bacterium]